MMNDSKPLRNPITHQKHRREVFWQIAFPLMIGSLMILGLAIWAVIAASGTGDVSQPADASLIFLLFPVLVVALIPLVLLAGLAYGVIVLNKKLPTYAQQAQDAMIRVRDGVLTGADKLVEPVLKLRSMLASLDAFKRK